MQPARQHRKIGELRGIPGESDECALADVLRRVWVLNHPQRGGENEIDMAAHQFRKRRFGIALGVGTQHATGRLGQEKRNRH